MSDRLDKFIKAIRPNGGHLHVAAIGEDHPLHGRVFPLATHMDELRGFITLNNDAGANIYYTLNEVEGRDEPYELAKPSKAQISGIVGFHADVDPDLKAAGGDYKKARERLLNGDCDAIKATHPTVLVDSGNGLQALYIADKKPECLDAAEAQNYGLLKHLGGDPGTHNIDRLLRMPFTINHADKRKQSKGYPAQSEAAVLAYNDPGQAKLPPPVTPPPSDRRDDTHPTITPLTDAQRAVAEVRWDEAMQSHSKLAQRWQGDTEGLKDKSRSAIDKSIGSIMNIQGFSLDEFAYLVNKYPPANSAFAEQDERYLRRCWERDEVITDRADPLPTHSFSDLAGRDIPPREWIIASTIPSGCVTSLYGIGGEGKTTISMQMAEAVSRGDQFMGQDVSRGSVLMMLNEDDTDEVGRRVQRLGADAPDAHVIDFQAVTDPCLMRFERDGSQVTQMALTLEATIESYAPKLVVLDPISFIFCGNENDRAEVGTFVRYMNLIASRQRTAILMIGHPAKDENSQYSGSTSWHNSVRSRLELKKVENTDDEYRLYRHKANYAPKDEEGLHMVKTLDGVFKSADLFDLKGEKKRLEAEHRAECDQLAKDFIRHQSKNDGQMPTKSTGPTSLFKLMKAIWADNDHPFTATELSESMTRLEAEGFIKQEAYKDETRHWRKRYVLAEDSHAEDFEDFLAEVGQ